MDPASLPPCSGQDRFGRGVQSRVRVAGDQGHPERVRISGDLEASVAQAAEELGPEVGGLSVTESHPEDLPPPLAADAGRDDESLGEDAAAVADVEVGGVEEQVGEPGGIDASVQELVHRLIDLGADSRYRRPADAGVVTQGAHQLVDLPSGHPVDPGLTDYRVESLVDSTAGVQQRREERPFPQFWDLKIDLAGRGRERLRAGPVAARDPQIGRASCRERVWQYV